MLQSSSRGWRALALVAALIAACANSAGAQVAPTPVPTPAPFPVQVLSDPHIRGFNDQTFDFTGLPDKIYAFISDYNLVVNTLFSRAYAFGLSDTILFGTPLHETTGTWIAATGWIVEGSSVVVSVENHDSDEMQCNSENRAASNCILQGSVYINGERVVKLGEYELDDRTKMSILNSKSFARILLSAEVVQATIDVVLPPKSWDIGQQDRSKYSHINLSFNKIELSLSAHGVLGQTVRTKLDENGKAVTKASDINGTGIIQGEAQDYEVPDLLSTKEFKYWQQL